MSSRSTEIRGVNVASDCAVIQLHYRRIHKRWIFCTKIGPMLPGLQQTSPFLFHWAHLLSIFFYSLQRTPNKSATCEQSWVESWVEIAWLGPLSSFRRVLSTCRARTVPPALQNS
ncbi:hypothetical protein GDO78_020233 [Eleutherodactylus coqui]|uniref:Uncharacterized protein n=1 Tax=Eleutherodactylus coqui TaxID=57060 RepID=A0A8J6BP52_ELECQ|nr:hypothetical protein GDO78_020233 [Eleutherodactylus coqui]